MKSLRARLFLAVLLAALVHSVQPMSVYMSARGGGSRQRGGRQSPAEAKRATQYERRKAGLTALKQLAQIYRERNELREAESAAARMPPPPVPPPQSSTEEQPSSLLETLGALAVAKMQVAMLRQKEALTSAVDAVLEEAQAAPARAAEALQSSAADAARRVREAPEAMAKEVSGRVDEVLADVEGDETGSK